MDGKLLTLPIGVQSFDILRREGYLYVDKTARLLELVGTSGRCFLSRPRRFGKSLTLSTLDAMFSGKVELFRGLAAEEWVRSRQNILRRCCGLIWVDYALMSQGQGWRNPL